MGTAPVSSHQNQPLHNFSLSLKWGHRNQSRVNHRCRRFSGSSRDSPLPPLPSTVNHRSSSSTRIDYDTNSQNRKVLAGSRSSISRFPFSSCSSQKRQRKREQREDNGGGGCGDEFEEDELMTKPWKLRPRRSIAAENGEVHGGSTDVLESAAVRQIENQPKSMRLRGCLDGQGLERKEKKNKFWISLSREEIEEDVYSLTGSRPARRPKKRPRTVQKQVDAYAW